VRVWVDLTNTPHVPFFTPIVRELRAAGHDVLVTARRFGYTVEMAKERIPDVVEVGRGSKVKLVGKGVSLVNRVADLSALMRRFRPDVAVSHGSYDQAITSKLRGCPQLIMVDYEFQPANHLSFRLATRLLLPAAFDQAVIDARGGKGKTSRYEGLKEEVYLVDWQPSDADRDALGIADHQGPVVTLRPAPTGALYHRGENPFFDALVAKLGAMPDVRTLVVPRHPSDVPDLRAGYASDRIRILEQTVDGAALVYHSDVVVSGGGTMNREAVALGVPVHTLFAGTLGSVDAALIADGRMRRLTTQADVDALEVVKRDKAGVPPLTTGVRDRVIATIAETAERKSVTEQA
jgi:predicted glycosyltransferase